MHDSLLVFQGAPPANELALLQINQLQEELEHYYIQYQKMTYSPNTEISYATDLNRVKVSLSLMNMK